MSIENARRPSGRLGFCIIRLYHHMGYVSYRGELEETDGHQSPPSLGEAFAKLTSSARKPEPLVFRRISVCKSIPQKVVLRAPVATVSGLTPRNGLRPVPNELTTPPQPFKARMRVASVSIRLRVALVTSIALDHVYSRQIGARLRANHGHDGMAFRQGVADDQPSGSARCTQNKNFRV